MQQVIRKQRDAVIRRKRILQAARPSWVSGAARLVDLGGNFDRYRFSDIQDDFGENALYKDWARVGRRLSAAMRRMEEHYR